jgi:sec-independent protein translocase protein TatA
MFGRVSIWEILLVLVIVLIVFGPSRIAGLGGELGKGIRAFQDGLKGNYEEEESSEHDEEQS